MKQQMTSKQLRELKERQRGILRGEIKPRSKSLQLATEEEWAALGLSGERVYTSLNPLGKTTKSR